MDDRAPQPSGEALMRDVLAQYGRLQSDTPCPCLECSVAGVDEPPVLVPHRRDQDAAGQWWEIGLWVHGFRLRRVLDARRELQRLLDARKGA